MDDNFPGTPMEQPNHAVPIEVELSRKTPRPVLRIIPLGLGQAIISLFAVVIGLLIAPLSLGDQYAAASLPLEYKVPFEWCVRIFLLCVLLNVVYLFIDALREDARAKRLVENGVPVRGEVKQIVVNKDKVKVFYEFPIVLSDETRIEQGVWDGMNPNIAIGEQLTVLYDANDPQNSTLYRCAGFRAFIEV